MVSFFAVALSVTAGWENICTERTEFPETEAVWRADFGKKDDFRWELRDGAEATVTVDRDGIHIVKTNEKGYVIVVAKPFPVKKGVAIRFTADQTSTSADVDYSSGFLRYYGRKEKLELSPAESKNFYRGGMQTMRGMPCTAPGMSYRKYAQCYAEDDILTPVIVVAGAASDSIWRNWFAADLDAAQALWRKKYTSLTLPDRSSERMDDAAFDRMLAAGDLDPVKQVAAGSRHVKAAEDVEHRRFARPGCAHDGDELAVIDRKRHAVKRRNGLFAGGIDLLQVAYLYQVAHQARIIAKAPINRKRKGAAFAAPAFHVMASLTSHSSHSAVGSSHLRYIMRQHSGLLNHKGAAEAAPCVSCVTSRTPPNLTFSVTASVSMVFKSTLSTCR